MTESPQPQDPGTSTQGSTQGSPAPALASRLRVREIGRAHV